MALCRSGASSSHPFWSAGTLSSPSWKAVLACAAAFGSGHPAEPWHPLSEREFEVAQLVAAGLTNRQIAQQLVLAPKTISAHVTHILTKLGAGRRAEIATWVTTVPRDTPP